VLEEVPDGAHEIPFGPFVWQRRGDSGNDDKAVRRIRVPHRIAATASHRRDRIASPRPHRVDATASHRRDRIASPRAGAPKIKTFFRKAKARAIETLIEAIKQALATISKSDALAWFAHCGYTVH